jgi:tetratricopeptide (TPR) repeat protein
LEEAEAMHRQTVAIRRKSGKEDLDLTLALNNLASTLWTEGKLAEAEATYREALAMSRRLLGEKHPDIASELNNLAGVLSDEKKFEEAELFHRETLAMRRALLGNEHPDVLAALFNLAGNLFRQGKFAEAETFARECLTVRESKFPDDWQMFHCRSFLGAILFGQKQYEQAESLLLSGYNGMRQREGNIPPVDRQYYLRSTASYLVKLYEATGRADEAVRWKNLAAGS